MAAPDAARAQGTRSRGGSPTEARPPSRSGVPVRRSHAQRRAETRARLLEAVVESIADVGFQRTTAVEIARRAGVTWGAVQHHFGGKQGILAAVLEESFARFAERLSAIPIEGRSLEARVHGFVSGAWEHFQSPHYRSMLEILLHDAPLRADGSGAAERMFRGADTLWLRLFADAPLPRRQHRLLFHYAVSVLSGLATALTLDGGPGLLSRRELEMLEETLLRELRRQVG